MAQVALSSDRILERRIVEIKAEDPVAIEVSNLNVSFGTNQVLSDVNINIFKNRITAFIGPSGCGKTTLLKCFNRMNDLVHNFKLNGTLKIDGSDIYNTKEDIKLIRRKVGMVFQQPNPFPTSIYRNLTLPIKENNFGVNKSKAHETITQKLKEANLYEEVKDRLHHSALKLSGGQQQRLCIARALTIEPEIILLDEPCSALDHISTLKIESMLEELKERYTIVIVTHNLQQATRTADYVAFFYKGRIEEQGGSQEVFLNPKSKYTQDYIHGAF